MPRDVVSRIDDADRLRAVARTGLLDTAPEAAFDELARLAARMLGAPFAFVTLVDTTRSFWKARIGLPPDGPVQNTVEESFCRYVVNSGEPLIVGDTAADPLTADNPSIVGMGVRAWAGFPLQSPDGLSLGSFCVVDTVVRDWSPADVEALGVLAGAAGRELALRDAVREAERANGHLRLLAEVGEALSETLEAEDAVRRLAGLVLPTLGDWSLVSLVDDDGALRDVAWGHVDDRMVPVLDEFAAGRLVGLDRTSATHRGRTEGQPVVWQADALEQGLSVLASEPARAAYRSLNPGAYGVWPLTSGTTVLGVLVVARDAGRPGFEPDEVELAANIAQRAGTVLHNARLYARQQAATDELARAAIQLERASEHDRVVAQALQQAMLTTLPEPDHLHVAARYLTADANDQVGGDWYDALLPPDGATTLMIGDVLGHDITAATVMGQLRNLLRAIAWEHDDELPSQLISRLDRAATDLGVATMTTLSVARIEQTAAQREQGMRTLRWSSAGHPAPVLLSADGTCRLLPTHADPPLAVVPGAVRADQSVEIAPGDTLLLYTDGLIETRDRHLDHRQDHLVEVVRRQGGLGLDDLLDAVVADMVGGQPDDDVALLAVRFHPEDRPRPAEAGPGDPATGRPAPDDVVVELPAEAGSAGIARRFVAEHAAGLPAEVVEDAVLLVSELVGNAVRYGRPAITLRVRHSPLGIGVAVEDGGDALPELVDGRPDPSQPSGRGLLIVAALAGSWGVTATRPPPGKTVWFELGGDE